MDASLLCVRAADPLTGAEQRLGEMFALSDAQIIGSVLTDAPPNVANSLISFWPLDAVTNSPTTSTPDLYSGAYLALTSMDSNNLVAGQFGNGLTFDGVAQYGQRVGGFPIYNNPNYSIAYLL